jgi:ribonuclease T
LANNINTTKLNKRFRGYCPVVVDIETGGVNPATDAMLEIGVVTIAMDKDGILKPDKHIHHHIEPFKGAKLNQESLDFNKIIPEHPFRFAISERDSLAEIFKVLEDLKKAVSCSRCILVGHNAWFDLAFLNAAIKRTGLTSPFHRFSSLDTASLCALAYGQTVLAKGLKAAKIPFDQEQAHSALYDAQKTAELFCEIVNSYPSQSE